MWSCYDTMKPAGVQMLRSTFVALPHLLNTQRNARRRDPEYTNTQESDGSVICAHAHTRKSSNARALGPAVLLTSSLGEQLRRRPRLQSAESLQNKQTGSGFTPDFTGPQVSFSIPIRLGGEQQLGPPLRPGWRIHPCG